ncbi:MAG: hypothetical protein PVH61_38585 [Candidatus Aminicenantes bacterium]
MLAGKFLKGAGMVTLFLFLFFIFSADFAAAQKDEDVLLKARRLYQEGDYEGSIKMLSDFISKLRAMVEQKKNVAEAFYLLAKIYYEVGDDTKVNENLRKCFDTYPAFTMEETNLGFKDRVNKIRKEVLEAKTKQPLPETETYEEEEPPAEEKMIEQPAPPKEQKKKKFPVLLVVGGIVVVGVVLALALGGGKESEPEPERFDIRGDWTVIVTYLGTDYPFFMTFSGSLNNGTFVDQDGDTGTYTVNQRRVHFEYDLYITVFDGNFEDRNNMRGTYQEADVSGDWRATRGFSTPITNQTSAVKAQWNKKN